MNNPNEPKLVTKLMDLIKLSDIYMMHAPKHEKHSLCKHIRDTQYTLYKLVIECVKRYHKKTTLSELDITHETLRGLYKVYFDLGYFEYHRNKKARTPAKARQRYRAISNLIDEVGRMIGGWIKYEKERESDIKNVKR